MKRASIVMGVLSLVMVYTGNSVSCAADAPKSGEGKGMTVEDVGIGLKSAVTNVEKEIPKIGSAIGNAFKKITSNNSQKKPDQESPKEKK